MAPMSGPWTSRVGWILSERQVRAGPIVIVDVATHEELYRNSSEIMGGAVSVKVAADTAAGAGSYWYELIGTSVFADSVEPAFS